MKYLTSIIVFVGFLFVFAAADTTINLNFEGLIPGDSCCDNGPSPGPGGDSDAPNLGGVPVTFAISNSQGAFLGLGGASKGVELLLAEAFCKWANCFADVETVNFADIAAILNGNTPNFGDWSALLGLINPREERRAFAELSIPYLQNGQGFYVSADSSFDSFEEFVADASAIVAVAADSTFVDTARQFFPDERILTVDASGSEAVLAGDAAGFIGDQPEFEGNTNFKLLKVVLSDVAVAAFPRGSVISKLFNDFLLEIAGNGVYDRILDKANASGLALL